MAMATFSRSPTPHPTKLAFVAKDRYSEEKEMPHFNRFWSRRTKKRGTKTKNPLQIEEEEEARIQHDGDTRRRISTSTIIILIMRHC
jgi:hypothetical protein